MNKCIYCSSHIIMNYCENWIYINSSVQTTIERHFGFQSDSIACIRDFLLSSACNIFIGNLRVLSSAYTRFTQAMELQYTRLGPALKAILQIRLDNKARKIQSAYCFSQYSYKRVSHRDMNLYASAYTSPRIEIVPEVDWQTSSAQCFFNARLSALSDDPTSIAFTLFCDFAPVRISVHKNETN